MVLGSGFKGSGFKVCLVSGFRCQPSRWPQKFTRLRRAASLIKEKTSLEPEKKL
jgi:hypothetical protein